MERSARTTRFWKFLGRIFSCSAKGSFRGTVEIRLSVVTNVAGRESFFAVVDFGTTAVALEDTMVGAEADDWATGAEEETTAEDTEAVSARAKATLKKRTVKILLILVYVMRCIVL